MNNLLKDKKWELQQIKNSIKLYFQTIKEIQDGKYNNMKNIHGKTIKEPEDLIYGLNIIHLQQQKKNLIRLINELEK